MISVKGVILAFCIILFVPVLSISCRDLYPIDKLTREEVAALIDVPEPRPSGGHVGGMLKQRGAVNGQRDQQEK